MKTICLNMIVKNERNVILRCLKSVKHLIDYWVIVDTGSTDGTQGVIKKALKGIPGELHERPWVNFGHNRNEALELARNKADYLLFIDADDCLVFSSSFLLPSLEKDFYLAMQSIRNSKSGSCVCHPVILLMKNSPDYHWEGVLHEYLTGLDTGTKEMLAGVINEYHHEGTRSKDPDLFENDIRMLENAHHEDPMDTRTVLYLGETYKNNNDLVNAAVYFEKRASMGGSEAEVFYSLYSLGRLQHALKQPSELYRKVLCKAYELRPSRVEPLIELALSFLESKNYFLGFLISHYALSHPFSSVAFDLFITPWHYDWGALYLYFESARGLQNYRAAYRALQKLCVKPEVPLEMRENLACHLPELEKLIKTKVNG